ncbi:MAG: perosamine synthetase, partial [Acidobacteria bacterium]|nr:perosamine synthetase [Acidobacteriota bacterium]
FHFCRSARRYRAGGDLTQAAAADAGMLVLHHPVLLEGGEALGQVARCVRRLRLWAGEIERRA